MEYKRGDWIKWSDKSSSLIMEILDILPEDKKYKVLIIESYRNSRFKPGDRARILFDRVKPIQNKDMIMLLRR